MNRRMHILTAWVSFFTIARALLAPTLANASDAAVCQTLDRMLSSCYTNQQFNGVSLVAEGDRVIFCKAYGFRELSSNAPNTEQIAFEIASVTKPITAAAILLLANDGKLKLEDDVAKFIPGFPYSGISIRHLLTHTSGLPDYRPLFTRWDPKRMANNNDLVNLLIETKPPVQFPAGDGWNYSNTGYAVLAMIIERVSGQSYAAFLKSHIFQPLGMTRSGVVPAQIDNVATGYLLTQHGYQPWSIDRHLDGIVGDGGIYSTAEDLRRFSRALFSSNFLGHLTRNVLIPVRTKNGGFQYNGVGSGLGWNLKFHGIETTPSEVFHTGNYGGFRVMLWHDLRNDRTFVLLDNLCHSLDEIFDAEQNILSGKSWQAPRKSICETLLLSMQTGGIDAALRKYSTLKSEGAERYAFGERELNTLGYILLRDNSVDEAIKILKLNTQEYPSSFNAFDSLAEAYVQKGDIPAAIQAYEQAVKINPNYKGGFEAIKALQQRGQAGK